MSAQEIILAEEQGASLRINAFKNLTGTLVLTNRRLVFVKMNDLFFKGYADPAAKTGGTFPLPNVRIPNLGFTEVYDLNDIPKEALPLHSDVSSESPRALTIDIDSIVSARGGEGGIMGRPSLEVECSHVLDSGLAHLRYTAVFHEEMTGERRKHLKDWAEVILRLKSGELAGRITEELSKAPNLPTPNTLEGRVFYILGDLQSKGVFQIKNELMKKFEGYYLDLDSSEIERACLSLTKKNLVLSMDVPDKPSFYRKRPPLGEEFDLSS